MESKTLEIASDFAQADILNKDNVFKEKGYILARIVSRGLHLKLI